MRNRTTAADRHNKPRHMNDRKWRILPVIPRSGVSSKRPARNWSQLRQASPSRSLDPTAVCRLAENSVRALAQSVVSPHFSRPLGEALVRSRNSDGSAHDRRFVTFSVVSRLLFPFALAALLYFVPLDASTAQRPTVAIIALAAGAIAALLVPSFWRRRLAK